MKSLLYEITPFTLLDYADHIAAIFWFPGCNMRCAYCYNPHIIYGKASVTETDALSFLVRRKLFLEAVVMSGGECTIHPGLFSLCEKVRELDLKVKVDTNGSRPRVMERLIENDLVNFISLDFKATQRSYKTVTKSSLYDPFMVTLKLLIRSGVPFEVRTTAHRNLLTIHELRDMRTLLNDNGYQGDLYIQNAVNHTKYLDENLPPNNPYTPQELSTLPGIAWRA